MSETEEGWGLNDFSNKAHYFTYRQSLCGSFGYGPTVNLTKSYGEKRCADCELKYDLAVTTRFNEALKGNQ